MTIRVADLPYEKNALEPHMSERTVEFHYEKHHKGYARKVNDAIEGTKLQNKSLEDLIEETANDGQRRSLFNNAAQVWNHDFFWAGMAPKATAKPSGDLEALIKDAFGDLDGFKKAFVEAATGRFGSGYAWLVLADGHVKIISTPNADTPLVGDAAPLLCCDVWEHAYYLDYQNARGKFVRAFVNELIDWARVAERLKAAASPSRTHAGAR
ncbi:MAG: superoxide dismutase [Fe] [Alphaproteobacteria bacterium]|nr:superoxide dismutase [Fe] [Alphaproteobacteria bacterium]